MTDRLLQNRRSFYPNPKGGTTIPCPHFEIVIVKRSEGRSAVAASAYLSGTRLYCEYDHRFRDYSHKPGVIHSEILLPERAPPEYADRATLWNSVESAEKRYDSQLARRIIIALPKELSREENIRLIRQFCQEQFVSKGMCCDYAVHDEGDGNPHTHVLLTMRGLDEQGKWLPKSKSEFILDENGQRIRQKNGRWKCRKVNTVDWNDQKYCEVWRHEWELLQNQFLQQAGRTERVDMRSFERQQSDFAPTVHMGAAITNMERKGISTDIGDLNREISNANQLIESIHFLIQKALDWIRQFRLKQKAKTPQEKTVASYLWDYAEQRQSQRENWHCSKLIKLKQLLLTRISALTGG